MNIFPVPFFTKFGPFVRLYPIYFVDIPHYIKIITQKHLAFIPYWGL